MQRIRKILHPDFSQNLKNFIFGPISFQFDPKTTGQTRLELYTVLSTNTLKKQFIKRPRTIFTNRNIKYIHEKNF